MSHTIHVFRLVYIEVIQSADLLECLNAYRVYLQCHILKVLALVFNFCGQR